MVTSDFKDVSGAMTTVIQNPNMDSDNPSEAVSKFVRSGGAPWAQSKLILTDFMDFSDLSTNFHESIYRCSSGYITKIQKWKP